MNTKKVFLLVLFLNGILLQNVYSQKLWDWGNPTDEDYRGIGRDTTISHLKELILSKNVPPYQYNAAARWLSYYHGESEKQFLLEYLHTKISEGNVFGVGSIDSSWQWSKYFTDQYIRGYLGDRSAIAGMDTVVRFYPNDSDRRLSAIDYLAEAGYYDYYDTLRNKYPDDYSTLGLYGRDARYHAEVRTILENAIRNNASNRIKRQEAADAMATFDEPYMLSILSDIYHTLTGRDLYDLFIDLYLMDPNGSPERTIEAVMKEPIGMKRTNYFPVPGEVEEGRQSKRYYEPWFIKFTRDWLDKDTSDDMQYFVGGWLNRFIPLQPDAALPILTQIDNLIGLKDTIVNYHWVGGNKYIDELSTYLQNARAYCLSNELIKCARQIDKFKQRISEEHQDTLNLTPDFITEEGGKYLYINAKYILQRLPVIPPNPIITNISPANIYAGSNAFTLTINGKNFVSGSTVNWNNTAKSTIFIADSILQANIFASDIAVVDSPLVIVKNMDGGESNSIRFYVKRQPVITGCNVKLINSTSTKLTGGALQYYEGSWKDAVNNNDGTFFVNTTAKTLSLRMTYEYGTQTKSNVTVGYDTIVFQTVNAQIQLQNSTGILIDTGSVQYYAGAWRVLGTTTNGIANKELLPNSYSFRMTYAFASNDKLQNIDSSSTVIFKTLNASVQLQNSQGNLIDQGIVQYYSGAWRDLGTTTNGVANKELLPNNYSFRMTYAYASKDKQQDISTNPTVVFQTVNAAVQLQNSQGVLIDQGTVQYYSGAWRDLGTTTNGVATKELLPSNYSFRMTYSYASKDKQQDVGTNPIVVFQTVNAAVQLKNSLGNLIDQGTVQYYSGAWRTLGTTTNGIVTKDLLPNTYSFRLTYEYVSLDKSQDISTNSTVSFSTVLCTIRVKNSQNQLVNNAMASYYSGSWRQIGNTVNGVITKELLPVNLSFRVKYGTQQQDKQQNLSTNAVVEFGIQ